MIDAISEQVNQECIRKKGLQKEGCKVSLKNAPQPRLVIDLDKLSCVCTENQTKCDYLFIAEPSEQPNWIVPIELKKGQPKVKEVERQLQAGAEIAASLVPRGIDAKFRPVVASGEGVSKNQRRRLKDILIRFRGETEPVRRIRCGDSLQEALE